MTLPEKLRPVEILLVEDSPTDAMFAREALEYSKVCNNLHAVTDGVEAMAFLRREGKYAEVPRPDLILLDLNLPKMDGREVLARSRTTSSSRSSRWSSSRPRRTRPTC